jgi:hypothetical protein
MEDKEKKEKRGGAPTFLRQRVGVSDEERAEAMEKSKPVFDKKFKVWFVNGSKYDRAKNILALIGGKKAVVKTEDMERKEHYSRLLAVQQVDVEDEEALPILYELLGGLLRTPAQQETAEREIKAMIAKGKKKMIQ